MNILNICYNIELLNKLSIIKMIIYTVVVLLFFFLLVMYIKNRKKIKSKNIIVLIIIFLIIPIIHILFYGLDKSNFSIAKCFVYANKKSINKLEKKVIFIENEGKIIGKKNDSCIGDKFCYLKKIPTANKEGYNFNGWDTNKKCLKPEKKIKITDDTNYYACFDKIIYKLTFEVNDGTIDQDKEYNLTIDNNFTLQSIPKASKKDYEFLGWDDNKTCDSLLKDDYITIKENTIYYACYKEILKEKPTIYIPSKNEGLCSNGTKYNIITKDGVTTINGTLIVNKSYTLPATYDPKGLTTETLNHFNEMKSAAKNEGLSIWNQSGYRSYASQKYIYNNYLSSSTQEIVDLYSARPGHSEHQSGMAIDINDPNDTFITNYPKESTWVNDQAYKYGFVLRYPKGKEKITGYNYEPWHFRYVGIELAKILYNNGSWITLEEYFCITSKYN